MNILVTGAAGFIGANLVIRLLREMTEGSIVGLDNLNSYYDVSLKEYRLKEIEKNCQLSTVNYQNFSSLRSIFTLHLPSSFFLLTSYILSVNPPGIRLRGYTVRSLGGLGSLGEAGDFAV